MDTSCPTRRLRRVLAVAFAFGLVLALSAAGGPASLADQVPETNTATTQTTPPDHSNAADPPGQDPETLPRGQDPGFVPPGQDPETLPRGQDPGFVPPGQDPDRERGRADEERTPSNRGTIKIQNPGTGPDVRAEHPHQDCAFQLSFFGFDAKLVDVAFTAHAPTGAGIGVLLLDDEVTFTEDARGNERNTATVYSAEQVRAALAAALGEVDPHPQQGYHIKVHVRDPELNSPGKQKVFWLDCVPEGGVAPGNGGPPPENGGPPPENGGPPPENGGVPPENGGVPTGGGQAPGGDSLAGGEEVTPPAAPGGEEGDVLSGDQQAPPPPGEAGADHRHVVDHDGHGPHEHPHQEAHGHAHEHAHDHEHVAAGAVSDQEAAGIATPTRVDAGGGGMAGGESSMPVAPILAALLWALGMGYLRRTPKVQRAA